MSQIIPIDDLLDILRYGRGGTVRPAEPSEEPDFVQEYDKLCTGMCGQTPLGVAFSFDLDPPVMLNAGRGYIIVLDQP